MTHPSSYFDRQQNIKTHEQMMEALKARTRNATAGKTLDWAEPVRNPSGSGHQLARGTLYVIRKAQSKDQWLYWAWHDKKLLGYSHDIEIARAHCQAHFMGKP